MGKRVPNGFSRCSVSAFPSLFFAPHFVKIVVEVKASGPPHVLRLWFGLCKGMLDVFAPTNPLFMSF